MKKPLCIDLYCGLGGWAEGFLSEGWDVVGFDVERHRYAMPDFPERDGSKGTHPVEKRGWTQGCAISLGMQGQNRKIPTRIAEYPAQLVLQDVRTLEGSQFRDASCIVASPPCQAYSYRAMPWKRARELPPPSNELFDVCFEIQKQACVAADRYIPMVVENVCGAQRWVGSARWHYGSYYLWGDVPALMPDTLSALKNGLSDEYNAHDGPARGRETVNGSWFAIGPNGKSNLKHPDSDGLKFGGGWWHDATNNLIRKASSRSSARKAASAAIAKIPFELSSYIARTYKP